MEIDIKYYLNYYNIYKLRKSMRFLEKSFTKNLYYLCQNKHAIKYIEKEILKKYIINLSKYSENKELFSGSINIEDIFSSPFVDALSKNENAIELLYKYKLIYNIEYCNSLSCNENSLSIFKKFPNLIDWGWYSMNPNGIEIIEKNLDKVNWSSLCSNPNAIHIIEKYIDKISWSSISENINGYNIIEKNIDKIDFTYLTFNKNPNIIPLLEYKIKNIEENINNNIDRLKNSNLLHNMFELLSYNENAVKLLRKYNDKINWSNLSLNQSDEAIELLEENIDKINWSNLSKNENLKAIKLLEKNICKIDWYKILQNKSAIELIEKYFHEIPSINKSVLILNPSIFELDYNFIKQRMNIIRQELLIKVLNPNRISKFLINENDSFI